MSRRTLFWVSLAVLLFIICTQTPAVVIIFSFLVMGIIPGTSITIPAWLMLIGYPLAFIAAVLWISHQSLFIGAPAKPTTRTAIKKTAPKKKRATAAKTAAKRRRSSVTA